MGRTRQRADSAEWALCSAIDKLDEFGLYEANILPLLRKAMRERWSSSRIRRELASLSQALIVQQGFSGNVGKSKQLAAIQDVLDRHEGKRCRMTRGERVCTKKQTVLELVRLLLSSMTKP